MGERVKVEMGLRLGLGLGLGLVVIGLLIDLEELGEMAGLEGQVSQSVPQVPWE